MSSIDYNKVYTDLYIGRRLSLTEISSIIGVHRVTISRNFTKRGLPLVPQTTIDYTGVNLSCFDTWTPEMAYWLGFIAADGSVRADTNYIHVTLQKCDEGHLEKLRVFMNLPKECLKDVTTKYRGEDVIQTRLALSNAYLKERLMKLGILPNKSHLGINFLDYVPSEYRVYFILGYFDGDGGYSYETVMVNFVGSFVFMKAVRDFFFETFALNAVDVLQANGNTLFAVRWSSISDVTRFAELHTTLLGDLPLERKRNFSKGVLSKEVYSTCKTCGETITNRTKSGLCRPCVDTSLRKVERPTKTELQRLMLTYSYNAIGRMFGVAGNTVKFWAKKYKLI